MPEIITRAEAKAQGLKRYFTGKPCINGHIRQRHTSSGACIECAYSRGESSRRRAGMKKKPPVMSMEERRKRKKEKARKYYLANIESCRVYGLNYRAKTVERKRERDRWRRSKKYQEIRKYQMERRQKIRDLLFVLRCEMPDLLKEFDL